MFVFWLIIVELSIVSQEALKTISPLWYKFELSLLSYECATKSDVRGKRVGLFSLSLFLQVLVVVLLLFYGMLMAFTCLGAALRIRGLPGACHPWLCSDSRNMARQLARRNNKVQTRIR